MSKTRLFTDEELKEIGQRTVDVLLSSIEKGDKEVAKGLSKRMYNEFKAMHDLYRDWITHLLTFIGERYGHEVLGEALQETVAGFTNRLAVRYAGKDTKRKMQILMAGLRGHLQPFELLEDDEKFTIIAPLCGSGGAQVKEGLYESPCSFLKIRNAQAMTFNRPEFPVYCAHCYFQNVTQVEPGGEPLFITEPASVLGDEPCRVYVRK